MKGKAYYVYGLIGRLCSVIMSILPKLIYRVNVIPVKLLQGVCSVYVN